MVTGNYNVAIVQTYGPGIVEYEQEHDGIRTGMGWNACKKKVLS